MKCLFCDSEATVFCDKAIALVSTGELVKRKGQAPFAVTSMEAMLSTSYTCDAPVCAKHARPVGHICGHGTIDHCHGCIGAVVNPRLPLLTAAQIDTARNCMHARYRRSRIGVVS